MTSSTSAASGGPGEGPTGASSFHPLFEISRGGMGRVELAVLKGAKFQRLYAIKRLLPHYNDDPNVRAMFLEEARLAGLIRHPNVVSVHHVGEDDEGPFLVMDFIEGVALSTLIGRSRDAGTPTPVAIAVRIALDMARGLHAAHELCDLRGRPLGLVHRDVSPQNVLLGFDGLARLTDFGVAKAIDSEGRTNTGVLKGKMGYMAPEQLRFEKLDRRCDLFSLGVVLYELCTGQRLYRGESNEVARRILNEPPPDIGLEREDVPSVLVELLFQLLAKMPADRPASAAEVATRLEALGDALAAEQGPVDLAQFLDGLFADRRKHQAERVAEALALAEKTGATTPMKPGASARSKRRSRRLVLAASAAGALVAGTLLALGIGLKREPGARAPGPPERPREAPLPAAASAAPPASVQTAVAPLAAPATPTAAADSSAVDAPTPKTTQAKRSPHKKTSKTANKKPDKRSAKTKPFWDWELK